MGYENSHIIPSPPFSLYVLIQWFITIRAQTQEKVPRMAHILARIYSLAHIVEVGCSNPDHSFVACSVDISMAIFRYIIDRSMRRAHALFLSPSHTPTLGQTLLATTDRIFLSPSAHRNATANPLLIYMLLD